MTLFQLENIQFLRKTQPGVYEAHPLAPTAIEPTIRSQIAFLDQSLSGPSLIRQCLTSLTQLPRKTLRR